MKKIIIFIVVLVFTGFIAFIYFLSNFTLFEESDVLMEKISNPTKGFSVKIYKIRPNATVQGGIQVRKVINGKEEIAKNNERYDVLEECKSENNVFYIKVLDSKNRVKILNDSIAFK